MHDTKEPMRKKKTKRNSSNFQANKFIASIFFIQNLSWMSTLQYNKEKKECQTGWSEGAREMAPES